LSLAFCGVNIFLSCLFIYFFWFHQCLNFLDYYIPLMLPCARGRNLPLKNRKETLARGAGGCNYYLESNEVQNCLESKKRTAGVKTF